ncbi:N-alpha-acetyltransferase 11, NatA catalytic subunit-like protein, partial [Lanmaoa asiatica]
AHGQLSDVIQVLTCNVCNIPENYYMRYWTAIILEWPNLSFLAEDESGKVVGYVLSSIEPEEGGDPRTPLGQVNSLSVLRPYRRLGLAQKLMNLTKDAMIREDVPIEHIQLHVRKSNRAALSLYTKLGYTYHRLDEKYYADEEDAYIMRLPIRPGNPEQDRSVSYISLRHVFLTYSTRTRCSLNTQRRARKTWIAHLWHLVYDKPHRFVAHLRRRHTEP